MGRARLHRTEPFDIGQIKSAELRVIAALTAPDVTAWVNEYTEDAVLFEPGKRAPIAVTTPSCRP